MYGFAAAATIGAVSSRSLASNRRSTFWMSEGFSSSWVWRNARVIYDVGLQTGRMTRDEAVDLMVNRVGFLRWAAEAEVDSALARPGYFIGYFMGLTEILKLREDDRVRMGDRFTLRDFHTRLLQIGSLPPALMREALLRR